MILSTLSTFALIIGWIFIACWWINIEMYLANLIRALYFLRGWVGKGLTIKNRILCADQFARKFSKVKVEEKDGNRTRTWRK